MVSGCGYTGLKFFTDKVPFLLDAIHLNGAPETDAIISALNGPPWNDSGTKAVAVLGVSPVYSC